MNSLFAERANSLDYDSRLRSRTNHFGRGNVLKHHGLVADPNRARRPFCPEDILHRHLGRKPKQICSLCSCDGNSASRSLSHRLGDGFGRRGEYADLGMYLREFVNPPRKTTNLATALKSGQSLIYRSTGSEVRELPGCKDRPAVLAPRSGSFTRSARRPNQRARALRQPVRWVSGRRLRDQS